MVEVTPASDYQCNLPLKGHPAAKKKTGRGEYPPGRDAILPRGKGEYRYGNTGVGRDGMATQSLRVR